MQKRQPFSELNQNDSHDIVSKTPTKAHLSFQQGCSSSSVKKNAKSVLRALDEEGSHEEATVRELAILNQSGAAVSPAFCKENDPQPSCAAVNTALINRLASEVAAGSDVVSAWEQVEELRSQLRQKDSDLQHALETVDYLQNKDSFLQTDRPPSAGQQLAQFLKDQLQEREDEVQQAYRQIAALQQQALTTWKECGALDAHNKLLHHRAEQAEACIQHLEDQLKRLEHDKKTLEDELSVVRGIADEQAEAATLAKLELVEICQAANHKIEELQRELTGADRLPDAAHHDSSHGTIEQAQHHVLLQPPDATQPAPQTVFHSPPASPFSDVFGSPQEAQHSFITATQLNGESPVNCTNSLSFQFQTLINKCSNSHSDGDIDDGASSSGATDDTVSEAAVVARTMRRSSNACPEDMQEVCHGLHQLKLKQRHILEQLATSKADEDQAERPHIHQQSSALGMKQDMATLGSVAKAQSRSELEEKCHFQQLEMKQLRSEVESLHSKCENNNQMLKKANQAMKILHYKLQKERKTVAKLQDEKSILQTQLLVASKEAATPCVREQVMTLQENLKGLNIFDSILMRLTKLKSSLQIQLKEAEMKAPPSKSSIAAQAAYVVELEHACEALRLLLDAAVLQGKAAHATKESSSGRLEDLLDSNGRLGIQLQEVQIQLMAAGEQIQQERDQHVSNLQQECEAADKLAQQLSATTSCCNNLSSELQLIKSQNAELQESLQVQEAECTAVREMEQRAHGDSQNFEENMCNMTGLIDAVQALQHRNQLLVIIIDTLKGKCQDLQGELKDKCQQHINAMHELQRIRQQCLEMDEAHVAVISTLDMAQKENRSLSMDVEILHSKLDTTTKKGEQNLKEMQDRLNEAVTSLKQMTKERETWQAEERHLHNQLASARKAQTMAQSRLILTKQREAQLKEASKHIAGLQDDLKHYLNECQAITEAKKESDRLCALLEDKVTRLVQSNAETIENLASAKDETLKLKETSAAKEQQLADLMLSHRQLLQQHAASQQMQQRLNHLESEHQSSAEWFDALNTELEDKTAQLAELQVVFADLKSTEAHHLSHISNLETQLTQLQQSQQDLDVGWQAASAALQCTDSDLAVSQEQCHALKSQLKQAALDLQAAKAAEANTATRLEELEAAQLGLQTECGRLNKELEGAHELNTAISSLEQQADQLRKANLELTAVLESDRADHQQHVCRMQHCVDECMAMCDSLAADLEAAKEAWKDEERQAKQASMQAQELQEQLQDAQVSITRKQTALAAVEQEAARVRDRCKELQQERDNLSAKVTDLEAQQGTASEQLQVLQAELTDSQTQRLHLNDQLASAIESRHCAQRSASEALEAEQTAKEALARKSGELQAVKQQLVLAEERLQQAQSKVTEVRGLNIRLEEAERQQMHGQAQDEVKHMLLEVSSKLEAQMQVLKYVSGAATEHATLTTHQDSSQDSSCRAAGDLRIGGNHPQAFVWRQVLSQALERIEALHAENRQLWQMIQAQLHQSSSPAAISQGEQSVPVMDNLTAKLEEAEVTIGRLQQTVEHLRRSHCTQQSVVNASSGSSQEFKQRSTANQESWQEEKRVLKAICKLALAVTMDQVGGKREAMVLSQELAPLMQNQEHLLQQLGLQKVWRSLYKLAISCQPTQLHPPWQLLKSSMSSHAVQLQLLHNEALHYKDMCQDLKHQLADMESAKQKLQGQANNVEQSLSLLRFQLEDLLSEVNWVIEDFSSAEPRPQDNTFSQLSDLVSLLYHALGRLLRKYRTLSSMLASDTDTSTDVIQMDAKGCIQAPHNKGSRCKHRHQEEADMGNLGSPHAGSHNADSRYAQPVRKTHSSHDTLSCNQEQDTDHGHRQEHLVAQAKAASIAEMLTVQTRAAVNCGSSRFVGKQTEPSAIDSLMSQSNPKAGKRAENWRRKPDLGACRLKTCDSGFAGEDIPLRQRYGSQATY